MTNIIPFKQKSKPPVKPFKVDESLVHDFISLIVLNEIATPLIDSGVDINSVDATALQAEVKVAKEKLTRCWQRLLESDAHRKYLCSIGITEEMQSEALNQFIDDCCETAVQ